MSQLPTPITEQPCLMPGVHEVMGHMAGQAHVADTAGTAARMRLCRARQRAGMRMVRLGLTAGHVTALASAGFLARDRHRDHDAIAQAVLAALPCDDAGGKRRVMLDLNQQQQARLLPPWRRPTQAAIKAAIAAAIDYAYPPPPPPGAVRTRITLPASFIEQMKLLGWLRGADDQAVMSAFQALMVQAVESGLRPLNGARR